MRKTLAVLALSLARVALAADGELSLGSGLHYSTGKYGGSTTTTILSIPLTARYDTDAWTFKAAVPFLRISGENGVLPGVGRVEGGARRGRAGDRSSVSGIGDSSVSATYNVTGANARSGLGLTGRLKLATGDESQGLGTGSNDVSFQVDAYQQLERHTVFGVVGYTIFGDSPLANFENVANVGVGLSQKISSGDTIGISFDMRQGGTPAPAPQRELTGFLTHRIDRLWRMQAYLLKGFARGSPDWGAGVSAARVF